MRPNIDLPWSLHGEIKEVAESEDLSVQEAYERVIRRGLAGEETAIQQMARRVDDLNEVDDVRE